MTYDRWLTADCWWVVWQFERWMQSIKARPARDARVLAQRQARSKDRRWKDQPACIHACMCALPDLTVPTDRASIDPIGSVDSTLLLASTATYLVHVEIINQQRMPCRSTCRSSRSLSLRSRSIDLDLDLPAVQCTCRSRWHIVGLKKTPLIKGSFAC